VQSRCNIWRINQGLDTFPAHCAQCGKGPCTAMLGKDEPSEPLTYEPMNTREQSLRDLVASAPKLSTFNVDGKFDALSFIATYYEWRERVHDETGL
jgi:hypothetical protein